MKIKYARLEDDPVIFSHSEAWLFGGGAWRPINTADANHKASLMDEAGFYRMFGQLPPLPLEAFRACNKETWLVLPDQPPHRVDE